ncbi:MAG TPA: response regulator [Candidatus Acidoferrum sp.]|nr:response regulator [Candidatus Acidoferrum sp.]
MKSSCSILVVDDDPHSLALLTGILSGEGYCVCPADSGEVALASIAARRPELILLDIRMPVVDGFEVCRRLRQDEETRDIPIVFLSAAGEAEERVEGLRLGAVDFISKPFSRDELLARVQMHLELAILRTNLERQVADRTAELRAANRRLEEELSVRRRAEHAVRESEERFRTLANRAPVGIWVTGPDDSLTFYNKRALTFVGRSMKRLTDSGWAGVIHADDLELVTAKYRAAVEARRTFRIECRVRRANGEYRWILHTGIPRFINGGYSGHIGTSIDITDLKRSHERSTAAQKLESLGALAAGMAHDFNNLIGSIFAASDLALTEIPLDSPARENIDRINSVATRAAEIVNLLIAYAGGHGAQVESLDLSAIVKEMATLLKASMSRRVTLNVELGQGLPPVRANATQLRQVVVNLVMNAAESLGQGEGVVNLTTGRVTVGRRSVTNHGMEVPPGDYGQLLVTDTGCGIAAEELARIFDPFYSTKFIGRGLGLAVVQGILGSIGGGIRVSSKPGVGSTFEVLLPCAAQSSAAGMSPGGGIGLGARMLHTAPA